MTILRTSQKWQEVNDESKQEIPPGDGAEVAEG